MNTIKDIAEKLLVDVDNEIYELQSLIDTVTDSEAIVDFSIEPTDLKIMRSRLSAFKDAKGMIIKASMDLGGIDNTKLMTEGEKRIFYKIARLVLFLRRIFGLSKKV